MKKDGVTFQGGPFVANVWHPEQVFEGLSDSTSGSLITTQVFLNDHSRSMNLNKGWVLSWLDSPNICIPSPETPRQATLLYPLSWPKPTSEVTWQCGEMILLLQSNEVYITFSGASQTLPWFGRDVDVWSFSGKPEVVPLAASQELVTLLVQPCGS